MRKELNGLFRYLFKAGLNLFSLFQCRLTNWFKIEFILAYKLHLSPLDLDKMEFYRIEYMLKNYEESLDEEQKQYKGKQKEYQKSS